MAQTEWIISLDDDLKDYDELFVGNVRDGDMLIRCKDCKHYGDGYFAGCPVRNVKSPDNFCSWAERIEE